MQGKTWDEYFMGIAEAVSENSKCLSRKIGAIIVRDSKFLVSSGYNGPVVGAAHCDVPVYREYILSLKESETGIHIPDRNEIIFRNAECIKSKLGFKPRSGEGLAYCQAAHAERNAIDVAARGGVSVKGCTMYMNCGVPCIECAKSIVMAGISGIVVKTNTDYEKVGIRGRDILAWGGVEIRCIDDGN